MANQDVAAIARACRRPGHRRVFGWGLVMFSNASDPLLNLPRAIADRCFGGARGGRNRVAGK